ncbi:cytochrome P450 [Fennellomyces sp. T-0311]|nr:cytochrome P450 [Fennellomyces sp. T-0311]
MERGGILTTISNFLLNQYVTDPSRFIVCTGGTLLTTWTLLQLIKNRKQRQVNNTIPTVSGALPVFGHVFKFDSNPLGFVQRCKAKYGPVFNIELFTQTYTVLTGKTIRELLTASPKYVSFLEGVETVLPMQRLIRLTYGHKQMEEEVDPLKTHPIAVLIKQNLKPHQVGIFSSRIQEAFKKVLGEELNIKPGETIQIEPWRFLLHAVSRISCLCFAGRRVGTNKELVHGMAGLTQSIINASTILMILPDWIGDLVVQRYFSLEPQLDLLMDLLVPLLKDIRSGEIPGDDDEATLVSMILKLPKDDGSSRSPEEAAFHFKTIASVSIHTTAHYTSFALHELACRPQLIKELRNEIAKLDERTPETVDTIALLDSFLREVFRCNTSNLDLHHLALQDFVLSTGQVIPKGSLIVAASDDAHRDPDLTLPYEKSLDEFDAYRFVKVTKEKCSSTVGIDFVTFGLGGHSCPGRYFAVIEIKYMLAELLMCFKISTPSGKRAPNYCPMGMIKYPPKEDIIFEAY